MQNPYVQPGLRPQVTFEERTKSHLCRQPLNGGTVMLTSAAFVSKDSCLVPLKQWHQWGCYLIAASLFIIRKSGPVSASAFGLCSFHTIDTVHKKGGSVPQLLGMFSDEIAAPKIPNPTFSCSLYIRWVTHAKDLLIWR